jgi:hypothetical protein
LILEKTLEEVKKLQDSHLVEIKSLLKPPSAVAIIMGGLVFMNEEYI